MGECKVKNIKKLKIDSKKILIIFFSACFIISSITYNVTSSKNNYYKDEKIIDRIVKEIEITAGSDYFIRFSSDIFELEGQTTNPYSNGLSKKIKDAIVKSPRWIQRDLTRQFLAIEGEEYADLIIESSKIYSDEIAFTIACSPIGKVPPVDMIRDNVLILYENDKWIKYADIIDFDNGDGNYYSTVQYRIIENEIVKELAFPPEIYYWYIVHPSLTGENPVYIYNKFWRDYLLNHNDLGYPLLKEKLSEIIYLWDCKSYFQPKDRTWNWSMSNHPTAIEAISYWIGKTVPEWAFGDRPSQPNIIAHEHNGWCGELQKIAVAAQRAALIPSVGIFNRGEDHVWREFYERGWHENDNWWADGGGAVDKPDIYAYGWNKDMSALHAVRGDDVIFDVTSSYIHPKERKTINFKVLDRSFHNVDGARIIVTVKGPKDITWIKHKLFETLEEIWMKIPEFLKGRILQFLYNKIKERIGKIPDSDEGPIYCIWNYTDINGNCAFELGQNRSYTFFIQYGKLDKPLIPARNNAIRILKNPKNKNYVIWFPFLAPIKYNHKNLNMPKGEVLFDISFDAKSYQVQKCIFGNQDKGIYEGKGKIDFFIVDENNFLKYLEGKSFNCYNFISDDSYKSSFTTPNSNWYFIFRNNCRESNMLINLSASVKMVTSENRVSIVTPDTIIFDNPIINIGESVKISGTATNDIILEVNDETYEIEIKDYEWFYVWDTSNLELGNYKIKANCIDAQDKISIKLIDVIPPVVKIDTPFKDSIIEDKIITIAGQSFDNFGVEKVEVKIDNSQYKLANGTDSWAIDWNISNFSLGNHIITAKSIDANDCVSNDETTFVLNESSHSWYPNINSFYHKPKHPTNLSNIVIYADVTSSSPFGIKKVVVNWDDGIITKSKNMFRYADNPVQERHEEDPLKNESNDPIFGLELGQFSTGTNVTYWIEAFDYANNIIVSNKNTLIIGEKQL